MNGKQSWHVSELQEKDLMRAAEIGRTAFQDSLSTSESHYFVYHSTTGTSELKLAFAVSEYLRPAHLRRRAPNPSNQEQDRHTTERYRKCLGPQLMKATDDHGVIAGYAWWYPPGTTDLDEEVNQGEDLHDNDYTTPSFSSSSSIAAKPVENPFVDEAASSKFKKALLKSSKEIMGDTKYWYLRGLATDPAYQRRGVARALLEAGIERSRREGVSTMLESVPDAVPMYERVGFTSIGRFSMDFQALDPVDGHETEETKTIVLYVMVIE